MISIDDERLWQILFDEACVEGQQADRIYKKLQNIDSDGWIPVEEGLPEEQDSIFAKWKGTAKWNENMYEKKSDVVHVTVEKAHGEIRLDKAQIVDGEWECDLLHLYHGSHITAWQPFPEPYRPKEKDK